MPMNEILKDIEALRQQMYRLAQEKGIDHPDVLAASQSIDVIVNTYMGLGKMSNYDEEIKQTHPDATTSRIYLGYVISTLRSKHWTDEQIKPIIDAIREEFKSKSLEEAARIFYRWKD